MYYKYLTHLEVSSPPFKATIVIDMFIISLVSYIFNKQTYLHTKLILYNKRTKYLTHLEGSTEENFTFLPVIL